MRFLFVLLPFLISILIGLGSSWMYFGRIGRVNTQTSRRQAIYIMGTIVVSIGIVLFLLMLVIYFKNTTINPINWVYIVIAIFGWLLIAVPSIFFLRRTAKASSK